MKLLICTQSIDPKDPIAGFFSAWVHEFAKHAEEVTVIALSGVGAETLPQNVRVISLGKENQFGKLRQLIIFYRTILGALKSYDAVFVHNVGPKFVILGAPIWKLFRKKIALWYVHKSVDWKLHVAEKIADVIFSSAPEAFGLPSKKIHFLGHGIDAESLGKVMRHPDPEIFTILQVGRITPIKHCEVLIRAAALFGQQNTKPFKVLFVGTPLAEGDEEYAIELRKLVSDLGLSDHVVFEGGVEPEMLRDYYARAHVTINMLPTGGMDKVVLESAAVGVPVLTTNQTFQAIFADLANRFVLPELGDDSDTRLANALISFSRDGITSQDRLRLQENVARSASLPVLISRIIDLIYGKTS